MIIENGVLYNVYGRDIENGTFKIPSSVTSIGEYAFSGCSNLEIIKIPSRVTCIGKYAFWGCSNLKTIKIPSHVTRIGCRAFHSCSNLKNIKIPSSATSIEAHTFWNCSNLKKLGKFKATNSNMTCLGFRYELGKWYEEPEAVLCDRGFHYCENTFDLFNYYYGEIGKDVRFFEVKTEGDSDEHMDDSKRVCKRIKLVREIKSYKELLN